MNNSYKNWLKGGMLSAMFAFGFAACSDDNHFDVMINSESEAMTLWQNIQNDSLLSDFAYILENTSFLKDKLDVNKDSTTRKMTYAEFLNSPQLLTVWAPVNGSFGTEWKNILSDIKALYATDPAAATAKEFKFAEQYIRQHIARFNFESSTQAQEVRLMNSKIVLYKSSDAEFDGVAFTADPAIASSNGILHKIVEPVAYKYNLYDFLESDARFSMLYSVLSSPVYDITQFDPGMSTPGAMNNEGKMEYVDSVFSNYNTLLNAAGAQVKNEDSLYVAIYPTNNAYQEAIAELKKLFNYRSSYNGSWSSTTNKWTYKKEFTERELDSLATTNAEKLFFSNFYVSPAVMGGNVDRTDKEGIKAYCETADSLIFTSGTILYNKNSAKNNPAYVDEINGINPAFTNGDGVLADAIEASNGIIYAVDSYQIDPAYSFIKREETGYQTAKLTTCAFENINITSEYRNDSILGDWKIDNIRRFKCTAFNAYSVEFRLPALPSGKYKIKAIMVPTAAHKMLEEQLVQSNGTPYVEQIKFTASVLDDTSDAGKSLAKTSKIEIPSDCVSEVVLFEEFNLEYSYKDLPVELETFPRLKFEVAKLDVGTKAKPKCEALNFFKIIVEPCRK